MKQTLFFLSLLLLAPLPFCSAQSDPVMGSDSAFRAYTVALKTRGNELYLLSDKNGIQRCADRYEEALRQRREAGLISDSAVQSLMPDIWKLRGDYHYEHSDLDPKSYSQAEQYFLRCRDYYASHRGTYAAGRGLYIICRELAQLYYKQGFYSQALSELEAAMEGCQTFATDWDEPYDLESQYAICLARTGDFDRARRMIDGVLKNYEGTGTERYGEALRKKAKIIMLEEEQGLKGRGSRRALDLYRRYFQIKKADALRHFSALNSEQREQYWMRVRPFVTDCYRLEAQDAAFLYDVTLFSKGLLLQLDSAGGGRQDIHATWRQVQQKLPANGCAIEFIQYEKQGRQRMGALVLRKKGGPLFVPMMDPDSLLQYNLNGRSVDECIHHVQGTGFDDRKYRNRVYNDSAGLYRMIWNPALRQALEGCGELYFAPDGYVHQIAIEYMLPDELRGLRCHRVSSTRALLQERAKVSPRAADALIIGGVDYESGSPASPAGNDTAAYLFLSSQGFYFSPLEGSALEVAAISQIRAHAADTLLTGAQATEQCFRSICSRYPLIHISTHGFFAAAKLSQGTDLKPCLSDNTLSESLLAFSSMQRNISNSSFDARRLDGVLSAREIASLDLSGAEMVVLSCCETGLGYVTADGVYGIQRGLKNAGAGTIICTLWEIDDEASSYFMQRFYRHLTDGADVHEAFYAARADMRRPVVDASVSTFDAARLAQVEPASDEARYDDPTFYDAFILIDD